mmetsp:Transcript_5793/g.14820  ORF Transcript_5793/g.14820 Transcript_5793/m.14820 type:complete len:201 (-) Transcript_5793:1019-1621(-)
MRGASLAFFSLIVSLILDTTLVISSSVISLALLTLLVCSDTVSSFSWSSAAPCTPFLFSRSSRNLVWSPCRVLRMSSVRCRITFSALALESCPLSFLCCLALSLRPLAYFSNSAPLRIFTPLCPLFSLFSLSSCSSSRSSSSFICSLSSWSCFLRLTISACCRNIDSLSPPWFCARCSCSWRLEISSDSCCMSCCMLCSS